MRAALALFSIGLSACDVPPPLERGPCLPERVTHVERFGYYGAAPFLAELSGYSNLSWGPGAATLSAARAAGIAAVVDVQGVFQIAAASPPAESVVAASWAATASQLRPDLDALAALYPSDEPYLSGEKHGVAPAEIQRRLEAAARLIHSTPGFERVRIATVFSDRCLKIMESGEAAMPSGYAWVGWDLYGAPIDLLDAHLFRFLNALHAGQRVIAVPDAFVWEAKQDHQALDDRIAFWLSWIQRHPQVVAVAPYTYRSGEGWTGARDLPAVRARYEQIGGCIVKSAQSAPAAPPAGP